MAPEILRDFASQTDTPIDIWSIGVILYWCLFGEVPFKGKTRLEMKQEIR